MIITNLDHLETLTPSTSAPVGGDKQSFAFSLSQGILRLSLNGKELLNTPLPELPADLSLSLNTADWQTIYQVNSIDSSSSTALAFWSLQPHQTIFAVASSSMSVTPVAL